MMVTLSEQGMVLIRADQAPLHLPATAREVYDVTGAGDTVIATLAACVGAGVDLAEAATLANHAAAVVVGKLGTATVSHTELAEAVQKVSTHQQSVCLLYTSPSPRDA